ncbi:unnamed protein product [Rhizophagus irregularis]|nr:unnamed protein product [Rhizophagus irregularis]CAB4418559.1 unnamed protein product [Rhizophagus irregularis]
MPGPHHYYDHKTNHCQVEYNQGTWSHALQSTLRKSKQNYSPPKRMADHLPKEFTLSVLGAYLSRNFPTNALEHFIGGLLSPGSRTQ